MCSGLNHKRISDIREEEQIELLKKRMEAAFENDRSHVKELSKNV